MECECSVHDVNTGIRLDGHIESQSSDKNHWSGEFTIEFPDSYSSLVCVPEEGSNISLFKVDKPGVNIDVEILLNNYESSHNIKLYSLKDYLENNNPVINLKIPSINFLNLLESYRHRGLTNEIVAQIESEFDETNQYKSLFEFISLSKHCLSYKDFTTLLDDAAEWNERLANNHAHDRHRLFKNIIRNVNLGKQYPVDTYSELIEKISTYNDNSNLKDVDVRRVIIALLNDSGKEIDKTLSDYVNIDIPFDEFIGTFDERYFTQLLVASVLGEVSTPAKELTKAYFGENEPPRSGPYSLLIQEAYDEGPDRELWKATLAYAVDKNQEEFNESAGNYLYYYAQDSTKYPYELNAQIYAAVEELFDQCQSDFEIISNSAEYWKHYSKGQIHKYNTDFDISIEEFKKSEDIAAEKEVMAQIHPKFPIVKQTLTKKSKAVEEGNISEAKQLVQQGIGELEERFQTTSDDSQYQLLSAWKDDLEAQEEIKNGNFQSATECTEDAADVFDNLNRSRLSAVADARKAQIRAFEAQLNNDYNSAQEEHKSINSENYPQISSNVVSFHQRKAEFCRVKRRLFNENGEAANKKLRQLDEKYASFPEFQNLRTLIDVYLDFINGQNTELHYIISQMNIQESDGARFRSFEGDYVSSCLFIAFAQRWKQRSDDKKQIREMVSYAIKTAISGRDISEWDITMIDVTSGDRSVNQFVSKGETNKIEFKQTFTYNIHTNQADSELKEQVAKEICAFANSDGGNLLIGVDDNKNITGLGDDMKIISDRDEFRVRFENILKGKIGAGVAAELVEMRFETIDDKTVAIITVDASDEPVFFDDDHLYVRQGTSSVQLEGPELIRYVNQNFDEK